MTQIGRDRPFDNSEEAAKAVNDAIFVMQKLEKKQPTEFIQNAVNEWFYEGYDEQQMRNIISWIDNTQSRKIALQQLKVLLNKQKRLSNALLTPKGKDVLSGLILGLVVGGFLPLLGYVHINADSGSVKSAEQQGSDDRQRPYANIGVTISSLVWAVFLYFAVTT